MDTSSSSDSPKTSRPVEYWLGEIASAKAREKDWRKEGRRILQIYNGEKKESQPFNILYSNTETLLPALYNQQPRPIVQRRFKDADPLGKSASQAGQRVLEYLVDTNSEEYAPFDDVMQDAVIDALLPGRGTSRVRYDADIVEVQGVSTVQSETICFESIKWDRWTFGFAKKWKKVPWIALEHDVTKREAIELFGVSIAAKLKYLAGGALDAEDKQDSPKEAESDEQDTKTAKVWEIWDKAGGKKVRFVAEGFKEDYLKVDDDPLDLTGFFPIPEPLRFLKKSNDQMPVAIYALYENQAKELNRITVRINKIVEAIKVRGAYDSTLGEIADLLKKEDNTLVPAENVAALQDGGLDKAIWIMPIEKLVAVLQQLYIAREQCKQVIYEITGISDILRGASAASETLGAQEIKQNWATLRLKRIQKEVARYARDLLRITLEIAANKFQISTFEKVTGLPFPTKQMQQAAAGQLAAMRAQAASLPPGTPPPPQMAALQQVMQAPSWEAIVGGLRNETQRQYRIDIETNSTVDLDATEDQKHIVELMTAMGQFLNGIMPLVESGSLPFEAAQAMLLTISRRFQFGIEIEDQLQAMQPPKPQDNGKQAETQLKGQIAQMELQQKQQSDQAGLALENQKAQHKAQLEQAEFQFEQMKAVIQHKADQALELTKIAAQKEVELAKLSSQRATEEMKAKYAQETELKKAALVSATQIQVAEIGARAQQTTAETSAKATVDSATASAAPAAAEGEQTAKTADLMTQILEAQGKLLEAVSAPKTVERDGTGRMLRLVPQLKGAK